MRFTLPPPERLQYHLSTEAKRGPPGVGVGVVGFSNALACHRALSPWPSPRRHLAEYLTGIPREREARPRLASQAASLPLASLCHSPRTPTSTVHCLHCLHCLARPPPWRKQQLALTKTNLLYNLRILLTITLAQQDRASCMHLPAPQRTLPHRTRPAPRRSWPRMKGKQEI